MKRYFVFLISAVALISLLFVSCSSIEIGYVGSNIGNGINGSYKYFNGTKTKIIEAHAGDTIVVDYSSEVKNGELSMTILDSSGNLVANLETNTSGTKTLNPNTDENYKLVIQGTKTEGSFDVSWEIN